MHENDVPPNQFDIKLITKKQKKSSLAFSAGDSICKSNDAHYGDIVKKTKPTKKGGQICKNHEQFFL